MFKSPLLIAASFLVAAAQASFTTQVVTTDPVISPVLASSPTDTLVQPLTGFTIDCRTSSTGEFGSLVLAFNGDKSPGYDSLTVTLRGFYLSPVAFDENGNLETVTMYAGSKVLYDRTALATPLVNESLPEVPFFSTGFSPVPFSLTYSVAAGGPVSATRFQVENFFYVPAGAALTFDEATVIGTVPEPASMAALGLGLAAMRRRRSVRKG